MGKYNINFISEEAFYEHLHGANRMWREEFVRNSDIKSYDGINLRYYFAEQREDVKPEGIVVLLHGYCGFWGKFHEISEYFWQAGYEIFLMEHRGHGYSGRQVNDKDLVHVEDYSDYVTDLKKFMDEVVCRRFDEIRDVYDETGADKAENAPKLLMFAHSMGGAVGSLFLEEYPNYFDFAILSSPMLSIKTGGKPKFLIELFRLKVKLFKEEKKAFPGGKRFDGIRVFNESSTRSEARYDYIFEQRLQDEHYHTYMASNGWVCAGFRATEKILKNAHKIDIPVLMLTAGNDQFVEIDGYENFEKKARKIKRIHFENSKHELFNDNDETRAGFWEAVFEFLG